MLRIRAARYLLACLAAALCLTPLGCRKNTMTAAEAARLEQGPPKEMPAEAKAMMQKAQASRPAPPAGLPAKKK
jgi:hypothetical protein